MAKNHTDGPTTFTLKESDLQGEGKTFTIGPKWQIKKIKVRKNEDGKLELKLDQP